ncbi:hypothetical protein [Thalassoglobus polymorphus]|uniref:Uncharacterized protein n=1 Tax=Thalassoglobus polymorphus TaxID=2527994 RepID=A0A517QUW1_9PLAN|nr:hypothetical protein [Thalassoglobus polymorphus]QDT35426.1 hypothetical protein Mal48_47030 [Thalassoglobus polymorphus]
MKNLSTHDSFVCSVCHRLEDRVLTILSHYRDRDIPEPYFVTEFSNVVAHHLQHVAAPSILLDIEEVDIHAILAANEALFTSGLKYNWPYHGLCTVPELADRLTAESVKGYQVMGSCGLDGFVLAGCCNVSASATPHFSA